MTDEQRPSPRDTPDEPPPPPPPPPSTPAPPPPPQGSGESARAEPAVAGYGPPRSPAPSAVPRAAAPPARRYEPVTQVAGTAARAARWTLARAASLLLTPLLILVGAFAVLRNTGVIIGARFVFRIPHSIHLFLPQARIPVVILGGAAVLLGLICSFTLVRFARLLPFTRGLIVLVETAMLVALVVWLFADNSL